MQVMEHFQQAFHDQTGPLRFHGLMVAKVFGEFAFEVPTPDGGGSSDAEGQRGKLDAPNDRVGGLLEESVGYGPNALAPENFEGSDTAVLARCARQTSDKPPAPICSLGSGTQTVFVLDFRPLPCS